VALAVVVGVAGVASMLAVALTMPARGEDSIPGRSTS
jgi:hypothetical protein